MGMDKLSAHLDRGWDLLDRNDLRGARASARRVLEIDRENPDAHCMLGQVAAREGEADEALEHFRSAIALDEGYLEAMLGAAEVLIHPLHDYAEAARLCDEVLEFAETPEEIADATLLKFDALLADGDEVGARALLDGLPEGPFEGTMYPFLIGRAWYDAGESAKAEPFLAETLKADPLHADANYFLGLVREDLGDLKGAARAHLTARAVDLEGPALPWSLPKDQFQQVVERACSALEPEVAAALDDALVVVSDVPGVEAVLDGIEPRIPVLIDDFRTHPGARVPLRVFIYQRNIERLCAGVEAIEEELVFHLTEEVRHVLLDPPEPPEPAVEPEAAGKKGRKKATR